MPNRIDASVHLVEPPAEHPRPNGVIAQAEVAQLPYRHDPVLPCGKLGDPQAMVGAFSVHFTDKAPTSADSLPRLRDL